MSRRRARPRKREVAHRLFLAATEEGRWVNRLAPALLEKLPAKDRKFVSHLVYTALRRLPLLDWKLQHLLHQPLPSLEPAVRAALRLGACELEEGTPPPPVVSAWVSITRRHSPGGALLVNAVLRRFVGAPFPHPPAWVASGLPEWLFRRWETRHFLPRVRAWLAASPPLYLRVNALEGDVEALKARIRAWYQAWGGTVEEALLPEALKVHPHPWEVDLPPSWYYLQDLSSMLVVRLLDPRPGERIWDVAAAPGGKTAHILALTRGRARVLATDRLPSRLRQMRHVLARLNARAFLLVADAREVSLRWRFDRILLDAPCSGLGPLRRKPEVLLRMRPDRIGALAGLQRELLENAVRHLRPGGVLVYATCTTEPEENEKQVEAFLRDHPEFAPEPPEVLPPGLEEISPGLYRVPGDRLDADFAFVARLVKRG